jgi:hypothetical protein
VFWRSRRRLAGAAATVVPLTLLAVMPADVPAEAGAPAQVAAREPAQPALRLEAAAKDVTVTRDPRRPGSTVSFDLGTYVVAGTNPVEIHVSRKSYNDPIVASRIVTEHGVRKAKPLPEGTVTGWTGLSNFLHVTYTDAAGKKAYDKDKDFCPTDTYLAPGGRTRPDAPTTSPYPGHCQGSQFTVGQVWGIQAGWSSPTFHAGVFMRNDPDLAQLPDGKYTVTMSVNEPHRALFGIPADKATVTVGVTVRTTPPAQASPSAAAREDSGNLPDDLAGQIDDSVGPHRDGLGRGRKSAAGPMDHARAHDHAAGPNGVAWQVPDRPAESVVVPAGPLPDLRSLPASDIRVNPASTEDPKDYLAFSSIIWNAGESALVIAGIRSPNSDLMDAYQYFLDAKGNQAGAVRTGSAEYDSREGHKHWHFQDFGRYNLLGADKKELVRSHKEAFCPANTNAIDLLVKGASWQTEPVDVGSMCGTERSLAVRMSVDSGWGDLYVQSLPGQSFDISGLPNGTYYIEIVANPEKRLHESDLTNNSSLREVVLGGTPGARTVTVPPVGLVP